MEDAVSPLDQTAAVGADPQTAVATGQQAKDAVLTKGRRILMCKQMEARAVKAQQPAAGAYPKIAVRGLREGLHGFLRQTVLRLPGSNGVVPLLAVGRECFNWRVLRLRKLRPARQEQRDYSQQKTIRQETAVAST